MQAYQLPPLKTSLIVAGLLAFFLLGLQPSFAQNRVLVQGKVLDEAGRGLPYASIASANLKFGGLTDAAGNFRLHLPEGQIRIRVSYIGYLTLWDTLHVKPGLQLTYSLNPETLELPEVLITSDGKDPAYGIIQLAIDHKKQNRKPFPAYTCEAYTKTTVGFPPGFKVDSLMGLAGPLGIGDNQDGDGPMPPEMDSRLLYLSETLSRVSVKEPNKVKENILHSRVSGDRDQFSVFGNLISRFDPYENRQVIEGVADRGIVSPIADNAFFYYNYKLEGKVKGEGYEAYKIKVTPKRLHDPVFQGIVYIADSSWALQHIDVFVTKTQRIEMMDTLFMQQEYIPLQNHWAPAKTRLGFSFSFGVGALQIPFSGETTSLISGYELNPEYDRKMFRNEILVVSDSALGTQPFFWDSIRPLALSADEIFDYRLKDSLEEVYHSPAYLDSMTRKSRKAGLLEVLLLGYDAQNYRKKFRVNAKPLIETVGFNPMEGWFISPAVTHTFSLEGNRSLEIKPEIRYGFAARQFSYRSRIKWESRSGKRPAFEIEGGRFNREFSEFSQINDFWNSLAALVQKRSLRKLYRHTYIKGHVSRDLFNGFRVKAGLNYEKRSGLENLSEYSWNRSEEPYDPNIALGRHAAFVSELGFTWQPFSKYIKTPSGTFSAGSKWPTLEANWRHAFGFAQPGIAPDFDRVTLSLKGKNRLAMFGTSQWRVTGGRFFSRSLLYFPDLFHFEGNEVHIQGTRFDVFFLMPYYTYSTSRPFIEGHFEHGFYGFLLNKIPGVRKLKLNEYVGVHVLMEQNRDPYLEMNVGLEMNLLKVLPIRVDLNVGILGDPWRRVSYNLLAPDPASTFR